ncbi:MAG: serine/threonine protein kinase [Planctomycetes bacterium]|nr:serine/threonine protein kinase [Planctomycetota bacterium]
MHAEPDAAPPAGRDGDPSQSHDVQQAVELFVEMRTSGESVDPAGFAARYPAALRPRILAQCREFLAFDGLLGHQEWEPSAQPEPSGRTFGEFVIEEELGRGGMGVVYLARQRSLNRRVALKVMASGLTLSKRHVERFRREAAAAAQLRHPAIVPVHSLTEVDGTFAIAMDYVAGRNLADVLDDLRLANGDSPAAIEGSFGVAPGKGHVAECAMLCAQLASALAAAHEQGVVHRDLKPRNVMIDEKRQARLLDFGLAKSLGEGSISMSGEITGTAHYMSPEQTLAKRVEVDHRADIFALGVILYELLTLKRPFDGKNLQQVVYEICFKEPVPIQKRNPKVPRDLVILCGKALEKDPQNRYQTAAEFEADLQRFLSWEPIHARPAGPLTRLSKFLRRHRTETVATAATTIAALGLLGWNWYDAARTASEADRLLGDAAAAHEHGEHEKAIQLATAALGKRNDDAGRNRLALYHESSKRIAIEAQSLCKESARVIASDRELALLLALEADRKRPSVDTRSSVLDALGSGYATRELRGHHQVLAAEWSRDGRTIVTTGDDGKAILWDAATGARRAVLEGASRHWVVAAVFFPDGERLATAGSDGTVRLWRATDGSPLATWRNDGAVRSLALDATGALLLLTSHSGPTGPSTAQVWDVATGRRIAAVEHSQLGIVAALAPNGRCAASWGGERGDVRLWDTGTSVVVARLGGHHHRVQAIQFSPDGSLVATAGMDGAIRVFSAPDGALLAEARHSDAVDCLAFSADGTRLLSGSRDTTARLWSLRREDGGATLREQRTFVGPADQVMHVAFDPTDRLAVVGGKDGVVRVFDAGTGQSATGAELMRYEVGTAVEDCSFDPEGRRLLVRAGKHRALVWDFGDTRGVVTLRQPGKVPSACFDPSGDRVATAGDDERIRVWNAHDGRQLWVSEKLGNPVRTIDIAPTGDRVVAGTTDGTVAVHRLADGEPLFTLAAHPGGATTARFVQGGTRILTAGRQKAGRDATAPGCVSVWNANDRSLLERLELPRDVVAADLSPDGATLASVEADADVVRLWTVPGLAPRGEVRGHRGDVLQVRFAPTGDRLLTAGADGTARICSLDGRTIATIDGENAVVQIAWSRDGRHVLTCAEGGTHAARLWRVDGDTVDEVLAFRGHRGGVLSAAFSEDGHWAVSTARDGTACVWPTDPVSVAERLRLRALTEIERRRFELPPGTR